MGLDNGIIVKSNKRTITRDMLPAGIVYPFDNDYNNEVEIAYWRKNWGLRNEIVEYFNGTGDEYAYNIETPEQVIHIIEILAGWLDEERWEDEGRSIWLYKEIRPSLIHNIVNLGMMYTFMVNNPDVYLEFYDSY